jgi:hypothetical protein
MPVTAVVSLRTSPAVLAARLRAMLFTRSGVGARLHAEVAETVFTEHVSNSKLGRLPDAENRPVPVGVTVSVTGWVAPPGGVKVAATVLTPVRESVERLAV